MSKLSTRTRNCHSVNERMCAGGRISFRAEIRIIFPCRGALSFHLAEAGLHGNTHFPMSDLNNAEVAELMYDWLREKGLD